MPLFSDLHPLGQRVWLDNLSRGHIRDGRLAQLIAQGVTGITSNPTIFHKAVTEGGDYTEQIEKLRKTEPDPERRYEALVSEDIRAACDLLQPVHVNSGGDDGYVSLEVAPRHAHDEDMTVAEAKRLHGLVGRNNLLIKVPGTEAGLRAFERLAAEGISVNVTLLFSLHHVARGRRLGFPSRARLSAAIPTRLGRPLVAELSRDHYRHAIAVSVATLAARVGARVVAEGVEQREDLELLESLGIDLVQGALLGGLPQSVAQRCRLAASNLDLSL